MFKVRHYSVSNTTLNHTFIFLSSVLQIFYSITDLYPFQVQTSPAFLHLVGMAMKQTLISS